MGTNREPTDYITAEQLSAVLNNESVFAKKEREKEFNNLIFALQMIEENHRLIDHIQHYQQLYNEALFKADTEEKKIHEEKTTKYLEQIKEYYAQKAEVSQQLLNEYEKKSSKEQIQSALDIFME